MIYTEQDIKDLNAVQGLELDNPRFIKTVMTQHFEYDISNEEIEELGNIDMMDGYTNIVSKTGKVSKLLLLANIKNLIKNEMNEEKGYLEEVSFSDAVILTNDFITNHNVVMRPLDDYNLINTNEALELVMNLSTHEDDLERDIVSSINNKVGLTVEYFNTLGYGGERLEQLVTEYGFYLNDHISIRFVYSQIVWELQNPRNVREFIQNLNVLSNEFAELNGDIEHSFEISYITLMFSNVYGDAKDVKTNVTDETFDKLKEAGLLDKLDNGTLSILNKLGYEVEYDDSNLTFKSYVVTEPKLAVLYENTSLENILGDSYDKELTTYIEDKVEEVVEKLKSFTVLPLELWLSVDYSNIAYGAIYGYGNSFASYIELAKHYYDMDEILIHSLTTFIMNVESSLGNENLHYSCELVKSLIDIEEIGQINPKILFNEDEAIESIDKTVAHEIIFKGTLKIEKEDTIEEVLYKIREANNTAFRKVLDVTQEEYNDDSGDFLLATDSMSWFNAYYTYAVER